MSFKDSLHHVQVDIEHRLTNEIAKLDNHAPQLKDAMQYALLNGGKRVRPFLAFATGRMLTLKDNDIAPIALALECIHSYSLVHDDLPAMDDDDLRRGKPTCHIAFDEATAILVGDALQTLAFDVLANHPLSQDLELRRIALIRHLSHASGYAGMCGGQALDIASTNRLINQEQLERLHNKKTGALIKAAVMMPLALTDDRNDTIRTALESFASAIGLAFQVQDDILDITSDSATLGKPQGSDVAQNKSTYPSLLGLEGAKNYLAQLHQQALHALDALPYNTELLTAFTDYLVNRDH
ncbi:(2E,6E)-farnesyl diphosphate synthase [Aestuariibacter sp. AA17]|uniref:(2E,6E)-farnesyl diphosphate synthase n=1 Tax=Fluctibacter corallii TaxID=2984329 RepID=A0ABT3A3G0_9ALTE|nr:farnesyl diphosphate synthase [Aestuariibacter sp. AA17]MCV2883214.1 (2E,6E)-farnesyl diphosphate synthase [Aestuariibacter sp. AA17]